MLCLHASLIIKIQDLSYWMTVKSEWTILCICMDCTKAPCWSETCRPLLFCNLCCVLIYLISYFNASGTYSLNILHVSDRITQKMHKLIYIPFLTYCSTKMYIDPGKSVQNNIFFRPLWNWKIFRYHILIIYTYNICLCVYEMCFERQFPCTAFSNAQGYA